MVRKRLCFGLKHLLWLPQTWLEIVQTSRQKYQAKQPKDVLTSFQISSLVGTHSTGGVPSSRLKYLVLVAINIVGNRGFLKKKSSDVVSLNVEKKQKKKMVPRQNILLFFTYKCCNPVLNWSKMQLKVEICIFCSTVSKETLIQV